MKYILIASLTLLIRSLVAQDIEQLIRNPVGFHGYLRMSGDMYDVQGIDPRRSPYAWSLSGTATLQLAGISFPMSFVIRDQQFSYGASFNQFGMSPYYKWIRLHLGWRSMNFSPYTLNGRTFLGGGFELSPGSFRLSGFYGTFRNLLAVQDTIVYGSSLLPIYDRKAYGAKIGFARKENHFSLMAVKAWDDVGTPGVDEDIPNPYYYAYEPKENLILGASFNFRFFKKFDLYGHAGASAFTENTKLESFYGEEIAFLEDIYSLNATSRFALAGDLGMRLRILRSTIGLQYKRVEPFYSTLTTEFFYNDIENITAQFSTSTRKGQIRFSGNLGFERNNLQKHQLVTSTRVIGSANLGLMPIEPLIVQLRYSNYTQNTQSGLLVINDTLRMATTSANYGLTANYMIGAARDQQFALYAGRTTIADQSPIQRLQDLTTDVFSLTYTYSLERLALRLSPTIHYNRYDYSSSLQERYGGGFGVSKSILEKTLQLQYNTSYSRNDIDAFRNGYAWSNRVSFTWKPYKTSAFHLSLQHIANRTILQPGFTEWRGRIQYTQQLGL